MDVDVPTASPIPRMSGSEGIKHTTLFPKEEMRLGFIHHYLIGRQTVDSPTAIAPTAAMQVMCRCNVVSCILLIDIQFSIL